MIETRRLKNVFFFFFFFKQNECGSLKTVIGQLGWITGQTRPDLASETCILNSNSKNATVNEII